MATSRLRVLGISTSYPVRAGSVSGIFVHRLYAELIKTCDVSVVCPGDSQGSYDQRIEGVDVFPSQYALAFLRVLDGPGGIMPSIRASRFRLLLLPGLLLTLFIGLLRRAYRFDILHANWAICGVLAGIVGKLSQRPVVTTLRGDDMTRAQTSMIDRIILKFAIRLSSKIICVSQPMTRRMQLEYPQRAQDFICCLNGVNKSDSVLNRVPKSTDMLRVVSVGSLIPRKAQTVLINALSSCTQRSKIQIVFIGDGPDREHLVELTDSLGLSGQITFLGELPPLEVYQYLAQSDVFVLTSRSEGRPNSVLEALACGLPVISTELEGVRELVRHEHNGWLFPIDDAHCLAELLTRSVDDSNALKIMGERGLALEVGTWADTAESYLNVFHQALVQYGDK